MIPERPTRFRRPPVRRRTGEDWGDFYRRREAAHAAAYERWKVAYAAWRAWRDDPANQTEVERAEAARRAKAAEERERYWADYRAREAERNAERERNAVHVRETFDDWPAFVARAEAEPTPGDWTRYETRQSRAADTWDDLITWAEAGRLARDGWPDGAERLADMTARLEGRLANRAAVQVPGYSVTGPGVLDMGRYLLGHPEPYMVWQDSDEAAESAQAPRVLKLIVNGCSSWGVSAESIYWRGAAAIAIVDMAERAGARVEVELVERITGGYGSVDDAETRITLKRPQDHVSTELLAFALANQATLRRLTFGYWETLPRAQRAKLGIGGNYGHPSDLPEDERDGAIYLPAQLGGAGPFESPEGTAKWVIETLRNQGIEVETV